MARRLALGGFERLRDGELTIADGAGRVVHGAAGAEAPLRATVSVRDPGVWLDLLLRGTVGAAEAYMAGKWDADDLASLVRILVRNRAALERLDGGVARLAAPFLRWFHARHANTRAGSRRNIAAHYDLGNEFYAEWLDATMTYSAAVFPRPEATLEEGSVEKLERICRMLDLAPGDHVLEIGGGWGSFAIHAAERHGVRVTTTTISRAQLEHARARVAERGLQERVTVLGLDYRDLEGRFDHVVSIEMVEAVGARFLRRYLAKCATLLKPGGRMAIQAITMPDREYRRALREVDFIQRYIFPGSFIPSLAALVEAAEGAARLRIARVEDIGPHYARTLELWRERFRAAWPRIARLGFDERFRRMWDYYLAYCEGGFRERFLSCNQILMRL